MVCIVGNRTPRISPPGIGLSVLNAAAMMRIATERMTVSTLAVVYLRKRCEVLASYKKARMKNEKEGLDVG